MNRTHLFLLGLILLLATAIRGYDLAGLGYWTDEFCTLSEAHGHGLEFDAVPIDRIVTALPVDTRLAGARPAWVIPGMLARQDTHPPLYFLLVRAWESILGDGEAAVRSLNVCFSVAAIALLFLAARPDVGPSAALWACLLMAVAAPQVQFAREARNYMPAVALSLAAVVCWRRVRDRPTLGRAAALAACLLAMMLTHYYAGAVAVALAAHAAWTTRRRPLALAAGAALVAAALYLALWGPALLLQLPTLRGGDMAWLSDPYPGHRCRAVLAIGRLPVRWVADVGAPAVAAGGLLFLLLPWIAVARPNLRLWVLWVAIPTGLVAAGDLLHATTQATLLRYTILATPGAYVLIAATGTSRRFRAIAPALATVAGLAALPAAYVPAWKTDFRTPAEAVGRRLATGDGLVVSAPDPVMASVAFAAFQHYLQRVPNAAAVLTRPVDGPTRARLLRCPHVWVLWLWPDRPITAFLPGYQASESGALVPVGQLSIGRMAMPSPG